MTTEPTPRGSEVCDHDRRSHLRPVVLSRERCYHQSPLTVSTTVPCFACGKKWGEE